MKESHYNKGGIEVIDFIRDQLTPEEFNGFCKGNILKYVPRSNHKGDPIADAQKVRDYADYWISANLRAKPTFEVPIEEVHEAALEKVGLKLAEKQQIIEKLENRNTQLNSLAEARLFDITKKNKRIDDLVKYAAQDKNKVAELGQVSTEKAQELADAIVELRRECRSYVEALKVRDEEIESMKKNIADRSKELVKQNETVQKLETKNKQFNSLAEMRLTKFESLVLVKRELEAELEKAREERLNSVKMAEALRESVDRLQKENRSLNDAPDIEAFLPLF